jgi:hypothetical protein
MSTIGAVINPSSALFGNKLKKIILGGSKKTYDYVRANVLKELASQMNKANSHQT